MQQSVCPLNHRSQLQLGCRPGVMHSATARSLAQNRTLARLLTCLVNEKFLKAYLLDRCSLPPATLAIELGSSWDFWIVCICNQAGNESEVDASFWVPLRALPVLKEEEAAVCLHGSAFGCRNGSELVTHFSVSLLDTDDISFPVKYLTTAAAASFKDGTRLQKDKAVALTDVFHVRTVMKQLLKWDATLDVAAVEQITQEMENSAAHLEAAYVRYYSHGPERNLPSLQHSDAVEWEQSIVEGHATHPMHKSRFAVPPTLPICPTKDDLYNPRVHFFAVPRSTITVHGDFEKLLAPIVTAIRNKAAEEAEVVHQNEAKTERLNELLKFDSSVELIVPVHEVQVPNVLSYFPFARQLPFTLPAKPQASIRTVLLDELPGLSVKLAVGVKVSSALRTISPWTTHLGPTFDPVAERVIEDKDLLLLCKELASIVSNYLDPDIAKHLSCIIREDPQYLAKQQDERFVVCAALTERVVQDDEAEEFVVNKVLKLDNAEKKERFFCRYANLFLQAFLPPLFKYGLSFEAHLQNVIARFCKTKVRSTELGETEEWKLVGFAVRDLGGIKVHQETLQHTTGCQVDVWNSRDCSQLAHSIEEVHCVAFHTMIQCHLHRFARALGLHYNAKAWDIVRREIDQLLPLHCHTRRLWLESPTAKWKAFIRMKLQGLYRDYLYTEVDNLIMYRPLLKND